MSLPRSEYPRPQFARQAWMCLNGPWQFEIDAGDSGLERGLRERDLSGRIIVPFCPESKLSGVGNTDFLNAVWYRREVTIPSDAAWQGKRVLLHFQAVDYDATVWVNGVEVARHRGGWCGFTCDLSGVAGPGDKAVIVVRARDDHRQFKAKGKQSEQHANYGCHYIRTTGIWQTVWMEPVAKVSLQRPRITPDVAGSCLRLVQPITGPTRGVSLHVRVSSGGTLVCEKRVPADRDFAPQIDLPIAAEHRRLWSPQDPHVYDLELSLVDEAGRVVDQATSYAGLRSVTIDGMAIKLNGEPVFQRLVLDQGYYPDGILTAPSDQALSDDITLSIDAGFNGARLHQKVFEERFLYHADRLGYLVWGEFGDWGCNTHDRPGDNQKPDASYITQWLEVLHRDASHPSIVGWCPLNETWQKLTDRITQLDDVTHGMFLATKAMDPTRPVLDASGYAHRVLLSDVYDSHDYQQDPVKFAENHKGLAEGTPFINKVGKDDESVAWRGQPYFVSEFGGIWWNPDAKPGDFSWGYGDRPKSIDEFYDRFEKLCAVLLDNPRMFGYCYTQLTDVYQEQNGIYRFDRSTKFDMARIRAAQTRHAAIEQVQAVTA